MSDAAAKPAFPAMSIEQAHALLTQPGTLLETGEAGSLKFRRRSKPIFHYPVSTKKRNNG
jgi:hypothetical protein